MKLLVITSLRALPVEVFDREEIVSEGKIPNFLKFAYERLSITYSTPTLHYIKYSREIFARD